MSFEQTAPFIKDVLSNMPSDWLQLTTHRLDIYNEQFAKVEFLEKFEKISLLSLSDGDQLKAHLSELPTAFDYIRLGHPLSCVLEWTLAKAKGLKNENVISFSSETMPIYSILRKNLLEKIATQIVYKKTLPANFNAEVLASVYGYQFELKNIESEKLDTNFKGTTILLSELENVWKEDINQTADFTVAFHNELGSIVLVNGAANEAYISEIQHVRRRESIAMTPNDCLVILQQVTGSNSQDEKIANKDHVQNSINGVANTNGLACIGSSGLSVQYAIMMGLTHYSLDNNKGKMIKFIVPPNCYGGTNDQARRVAACLDNVEVLDLPVDGGEDMVQSVEKVLTQVAELDAIPFIIAEIPTNPRVEVPDLEKLRAVLSKERTTKNGEKATAPVFILDQTFCPNVKFLGEGDFLSSVETISYVSGSKFPSGGLCTAGYCVANAKAEHLMSYVDNHLSICGNQANNFQLAVLEKQMPSMNARIDAAYKGTRDFVNHIQATLPEAKINFVSEDLAKDGFTPSVFSLDLPAKGDSAEAKENYKRDLNLKLINMMIKEIPDESKHCVSYGQLKGCYWTIPATSTQGTTKEGDKDYIVRVALAPEFNVEKHKQVFTDFCQQYFN